MTWTIAGIAAAAALLASRRFGWLTRSGQAAAFVIGLVMWVGAGAAGVALLLFFFVSSSLLSRIGARNKRTAEHDDRAGRRASQVLANGGVAAVAVLVGVAGYFSAAYAVVGALAAATADTWATEVGTAGRWSTRSVVTWREVAPGSSGGVSLPGTVAGVAGAASLGLVALGLFAGAPDLAASPVAQGPIAPAPSVGWVAVAVVSGTVGMFVDSLLGATLEARLGLLGNDGVNGACTLTGGLAALILATVA